MKFSEMRRKELAIAELSLYDVTIRFKLNKLYDFFAKYSLIDKFAHERVLRKLFDSRNVYSFTSICREEHIDEKTLYRYRKIYRMIYDAIDNECQSGKS